VDVSREAVVLFHTSNHAIRAERVLDRAGIACKLVPVPRHLSSDCGVCLRIAQGDQGRVRETLNEARVEIAEIHAL
jgi:hypothetical protein